MKAARAPGSDKNANAIAQAPPPPGALRRAGAARRDYQQLWFALARKHWRSIVLVPADEGGSAAAIAASLADVGRKLRTPVTFLIMADPLDFESAAKVIAAFDLTRQGGEPLAVATTGKVIVAIQPVVVEPLGLAVTEAADAVVLCIDVGRTRLAAARRTIELIGRERIAGTVLVT